MSRTLLLLAVLLIAPGLALGRYSNRVDLVLSLGLVAAISVLTLVLYRFDKSQAAGRGRRIPEWVLHACELLGGWPAALVAQRVWHHKTRKTSYRIAFWLIVSLHQIAAIQYLIGWARIRSWIGG